MSPSAARKIAEQVQGEEPPDPELEAVLAQSAKEDERGEHVDIKVVLADLDAIFSGA